MLLCGLLVCFRCSWCVGLVLMRRRFVDFWIFIMFLSCCVLWRLFRCLVDVW